MFIENIVRRRQECPLALTLTPLKSKDLWGQVKATVRTMDRPEIHN